MHDLVIRGGKVVDGTGAPAVEADVAIDDGRVTLVGRVDAEGEREIDATGRLVTPGFVDIHTHYDGQVTWDPLLTPSTCHGVTTVVMGNCGVGFAPARPDKHEWLIGLMEGVEDIPGAALSEGIQWGWETFPEFLDFVGEQELAIDVGTQVPHGSVRGYVMGERGAKNEPATPEDIEAMAQIVREGIEAGALGVSTSRTIAHRAIDGEPVPGTYAAEDELFALGRALSDAGTGVFELAPAGVMGEDLAASEKEMDWMRRLSRETGRPVTFALLQHDFDPDQWKKMLDLATEAHDEGVPVRPQVAGRPLGLLLGLQTFHPLHRRPSFEPLLELPLDEKVERCATRSCGRRSSPRARLPTTAWRSSAWGSTGSSGSASRPTTSPRPTRASRHSPSAPVSTRRSTSTTCCSRTTAASCCCGRSSGTATSPRTRSARWSSTRRPRSASATVVRTSAPSATRASRRTCSRTGCATAVAVSACPSSWWSAR